MGNKKELVSASLVVALWSAVSKVSGLVRDALVAFFLGTSGAADVLYLAFQLPNLFRRFYGDGAFSSLLIPELSAIFDEDSKNAFLSRVFIIMGAVGALLSFLVVVFSSPIVAALFPGTIGDAAILAKVAALLRLMSAYLFFASLAMVCKGLFESAKIFSVSAATFLLFNLTIIVFLLFFRSYFASPSRAFAVGVAVGGAIQFFTHLFFLHRLPFRFTLKKKPPDSTASFFRKALPVLLATGVFQVNMLVGRGAASFLSTGQVSSLDYASRIIEIVLGLTVLPLSATILPHISEAVVSTETKAAEVLTRFSLKLITIVTIPATVGLCLLSQPIAALLFQRGQFGEKSTVLTADALFYFALGLLFLGIFKLLAQVSFSFHNTALPFRAAGFAFTVNFVFCILLSGPMANGGIALSATLGALAGMAVLMGGISRHIKIHWGNIAGIFLRSAIAAGVMAEGIFLLNGHVSGTFSVLLLIAAGIILYALALSVLMMGEWKEMIAVTTGRRKP